MATLKAKKSLKKRKGNIEAKHIVTPILGGALLFYAYRNGSSAEYLAA